MKKQLSKAPAADWIENLTPGCWLWFQYGIKHSAFYVQAVVDDAVVMSTPSWCVSSQISIPKSQLRAAGAKYLGMTRKRLWWKILPWRDLVCPFQPHSFV